MMGNLDLDAPRVEPEIPATPDQLGITEVRRKARTLYLNWNGQFEVLFRTLVNWFMQAYGEFEHNHCMPLVRLQKRLRHKMDTFAQHCLTHYREVHEAALRTLKADFRDAVFTVRQKKQRNAERQLELELLRDAAAADLAKAKIQTAGSDDAVIPPPRKRTALGWALAGAAVAMVMAIEYLTGYGIWEFGTDPNIALGLSLITVFGFTGLTTITVSALKKYLAHRDALKRHRRKYPTGHPEGVQVDLFPAATRYTALLGLAALVVVSVLLLGSRLWIIYTGDGEFGGAAAAFGLVFVVFAYGLAEFFLTADPYTPEQYTAVSEIEDYLKGVETEMTEIAEKRNLLDEQLAAARLKYTNSLAAARERLGIEARELNSDAKSYLGLARGYDAAWRLFEREYMTTVKEVIEQVVNEHKLDATNLPYGTPEEDNRIRQLLISEMQRRYDDRELVDQMHNYTFEVQIPAIPDIDFGELEREARQSSVINLPAF